MLINSTAEVQPVSNEPYSTKRHGLNIANCDSEPVQTPGCVQGHGALLVLRLIDLCVVQASENSAAVIGQSVASILNAPVGAVIGMAGERQLRAMLAEQSTDRNPLYLLTVPPSDSCDGVTDALDVVVHSMDGVVILEFEPARLADDSIPDYYEIATKTVARLQKAASLLELCDFAAQEVRKLTGMDRVMVYKFHEDGHGEVFAENKCANLAPWLGMHYPAEDIPKPARDIFTKTWLRPIPEMSDALAEMVPLLNPETGSPLDMTYCFLRGVSKMCTEYYRNMGVAATLTMSIRRGARLWGLISCTNHAGPRYHSYQVRAACEFLAQVVSLQHNVAEDKEDVASRLKLEDAHALLVNAVREQGFNVLGDDKLSFLAGIDAGGAALYRDKNWYCVGKTPDLTQLSGLADWLYHGKGLSDTQPVYATVCLAHDYPAGSRFANVASGLLALRFSRRKPDLMLWFKPETMQNVTWGGNPHDKPLVVGPNGPRLMPRASFKLFVESVRGRSLPWKQMELELVAKLRLQLIDVASAGSKQHARVENDFTRRGEELNAFQYIARRELKKPLRDVQQYAIELIEGTIQPDENHRGKLDRMLQLTVRMDSILDSLLHFSHVGEAGCTHETVDLNTLVAEIIPIIGRSTDRPADVVLPRPLPAAACNRGWSREIFTHLLSNAARFNESATKRIEVGTIAPSEAHARPGCPHGSQQNTIFYVADNGIGIEPQYFSQIFKLFKRLHGQDEYGGGSGTGLTLARKLVERHGGKIWLTSVLGIGTTFYFTLPHGDRP